MINDFSKIDGESDIRELATIQPNEFNDPDATACANGDYNTWEENQVFNEEN